MEGGQEARFAVSRRHPFRRSRGRPEHLDPAVRHQIEEGQIGRPRSRDDAHPKKGSQRKLHRPPGGTKTLRGDRRDGAGCDLRPAGLGAVAHLDRHDFEAAGQSRAVQANPAKVAVAGEILQPSGERLGEPLGRQAPRPDQPGSRLDVPDRNLPGSPRRRFRQGDLKVGGTAYRLDGGDPLERLAESPRRLARPTNAQPQVAEGAGGEKNARASKRARRNRARKLDHRALRLALHDAAESQPGDGVLPLGTGSVDFDFASSGDSQQRSGSDREASAAGQDFGDLDERFLRHRTAREQGEIEISLGLGLLRHAERSEVAADLVEQPSVRERKAGAQEGLGQRPGERADGSVARGRRLVGRLLGTGGRKHHHRRQSEGALVRSTVAKARCTVECR